MADTTLSLCSLNVVVHTPSLAVHSRTVLSDAADAIHCPSGENSTALIVLSYILRATGSFSRSCTRSRSSLSTRM